MEGRIEVRDLSFAVPDGTRLLSDVNFELEQGEHMALVGLSGSGKSTLIAVVHRLDIIKSYDQVAVMKAGKIVEMGSYEELVKKWGRLHELVSHDR